MTRDDYDSLTLEERNRLAIAHGRRRPRGIYVPTFEASLLLVAGWQLMDDCPDGPGNRNFFARDEVLLRPPLRESA